MKKKKVLIVGAGNVGQRIARLLRGKAQVFTTRRSRHAGASYFIRRRELVLNLDAPRRLYALKKQRWDAVIHLAPPPTQGQRDTRTQHLLQVLTAHQKKPPCGTSKLKKAPRTRKKSFSFIYVSTSGVYGDCAGKWVSESRAPCPQSPRAQRRWHAEKQIAAVAKRQHWRTTVLRAPGIYDAEHLPLQRIRLGIPAIQADQDSYSNHIHADDLARCCVAALRSRRNFRVYNASDNTVLKMGDWFDQVADTFALPRPPRLPRAQVQQQVNPMLWSFMRESRRLMNQRLHRELKIKLRWSTVTEFLLNGLVRRPH